MRSLRILFGPKTFSSVCSSILGAVLFGLLVLVQHPGERDVEAQSEPPPPTTIADAMAELRSADMQQKLRAAEYLRRMQPDSTEREEAQKSLLRILRDEPVNDERLAIRLAKVLDAWGVDLTSVL